jgi:hypothetical protein
LSRLSGSSTVPSAFSVRSASTCAPWGTWTSATRATALWSSTFSTVWTRSTIEPSAKARVAAASTTSTLDPSTLLPRASKAFSALRPSMA